MNKNGTTPFPPSPSSTGIGGHPHQPSRGGKLGAMSWKLTVALAVILSAAAVGGYAWKRGHAAAAIDLERAAKCKVERGELVISLIQTGELESKRSEIIKNETGSSSTSRQSGATIVSIVEDGSRVKKGDVLVQLDAQDLLDNMLKVQSEVARAEAELERAKKADEISDLKNETDLRSSNLKIELAEVDLRKFVEADYPQLRRLGLNDINLAEEELKRANNTLFWTQKLVEKEYASKLEFESDDLARKRAEIKLKNATESLRILDDYTSLTQLKKLTDEITKTKSDRDLLVKSYEAEKMRQKRNVEAQQAELENAKKRLQDLQSRVQYSRVLASHDGTVFYPVMFRGREDRRVEKGATVYFGQTILEFPDLSSWQIKAGVPESVIDRVRKGQQAFATIDAMPGRILEAVVDRIGMAPDSSGRWMGGSSGKTYTVTLDIPTTPTLALKPGMSVTAEIITNKIKDTLHVPVQAVTTRDKTHYVYLIENKKVKPVAVQVGESNDKRIQILSGLKEGDELLLYAPVEAEVRSGIKDKPLEKAQEEGREVSTPPEQGAGRPPSRGRRPGAETGLGQEGMGAPDNGFRESPGERPAGTRGRRPGAETGLGQEGMGAPDNGSQESPGERPAGVRGRGGTRRGGSETGDPSGRMREGPAPGQEDMGVPEGGSQGLPGEAPAGGRSRGGDGSRRGGPADQRILSPGGDQGAGPDASGG